MTEKHNNSTAQTYNPQFRKDFLHPKHWGTWFAIGLTILLAFVPYRLRDRLAVAIAKQAIKINSSAKKRAVINLQECFPELDQQARDEILLETYINAGCTLLSFAVLLVRSKEYVEKRSTFTGEEHLFSLLEQGHNIILLVPHTWAIDYPGVLLASRGQHVAAMMKKQRNDVIDWLINVQRLKYGGRTHERDAGIKPFIKSIRDGYLGYYLPDEDHGPEHSVFTDFLGTQKATLAGLGKLSRLSKAKIVPVIPYYDRNTGIYTIEVQQELQDFPSGDETLDARNMNIRIEEFIRRHPGQYMWILNLLRSKPDGSQRY
ncbi:lauroyl acyltransferase [Photobacterium aquae]|uniref:Lipid A biosynthesis acyltransferase n=1 Tax=Photobacterium aquae TaxID=1195763 RepID=A0A0J1H6U9_9GAMM|nr:lauroyl-Kdo(2)-lipid IV(A) myristoyltransferase [Photobacterium aquae]KLV07448.1 lauroyl acyltransferase [Photobacterium aquae]